MLKVSPRSSVAVVSAFALLSWSASADWPGHDGREQLQRTAVAQADLNEFVSLSRGIAAGRTLSMERLRLEHLERVLQRADLIIAPESVHLWLDSSTRLQPTPLPAPEGP